MRKPLAEQRAELAAMASRETATRQEVILETRLHKPHGALSKSIADGNGLLAARDIGVLGELQPIEFENPFSLAHRVVQAKIASEHFGVAMISPILPAEAEHIGEQIESATADNLMGILSGLRNGLGQDGAFSLVATLAKKRPEIAVALLLNKERPDLSRDVIHEPDIEQAGAFHPLVQFVQEEGSPHNTIRHPRTCSTTGRFKFYVQCSADSHLYAPLKIFVIPAERSESRDP